MTNQQPRLPRRGGAENAADSGQVLVELALLFPLLLLLLLGAVEFAQLEYMAIELTNAAKAAAQYGSQNEVYAADTAGIQLVAQKEAAYTYSVCTNFTTTVSPAASTNCACVVNGSVPAATSGQCTAACGGYIVEVLNVTTSASCNPFIHMPGSTGSFTLQGHAVQEVLQ